jgi:hypothetical protein
MMKTGGVAKNRKIPDSELVQRMVAHQCPVTCGLPTVQSRAGFERACVIKREEGRAARCLNCEGLPAELTVIEIAAGIIKEEHMAQREAGKCEHCGEQKNIKTCSGKKVCAYCEILRICAKKRPDTVVAALLEFSPTSLTADSRTTDRFFALKGENNNLLSEINRLTLENKALLESIEAPVPALRDLALRLALAIMRANVDGLTIDDVELLRGC